MSLKLLNAEPLLAWVKNFKTNKVLEIIPVPREIYGCPIRPDIIQRVVTWYRAGIRAGTACTKERGEVSGSGRKLRPQKGSGKARVGSSRTPNRIGGGIAFGPKPKDFSFHLPRKILELGFRTSLSAKYMQDELLLIDHESLNLDSHKTKALASLLEHYYSPSTKILIIDTEPASKTFLLASRHLKTINFMTIEDEPNVYHLLDNKLLILTTRASDYYYNLLGNY